MKKAIIILGIASFVASSGGQTNCMFLRSLLECLQSLPNKRLFGCKNSGKRLHDILF